MPTYKLLFFSLLGCEEVEQFNQGSGMMRFAIRKVLERRQNRESSRLKAGRHVGASTVFVMRRVERKGRFHKSQKDLFLVWCVEWRSSLGRTPDFPSQKMPWNDSFLGILLGTWNHQGTPLVLLGQMHTVQLLFSFLGTREQIILYNASLESQEQT